MSYIVTVPKYEDLDDGDGYNVTVYHVRVEIFAKLNDPKPKVKYILKKRYSDFSKLHSTLKELFPEIVESFRFPNKSMFNTNAEFTKIRRQQGFDEFLKILLSMDECIDELEEFLEIDKGLLLTDDKINQENKSIIKPQVTDAMSENPTNQQHNSQKSLETTPVRSNNTSSHSNQIPSPLSPTEVIQIPIIKNVKPTASITPLIDKLENVSTTSQSITASAPTKISIPISIATTSNTTATTTITTTNNNNEKQSINEKNMSTVNQKNDEKNVVTTETVINKSSNIITNESIQSQQINQIIIDKIKTQIPNIIPTSLFYIIIIYLLSYFGNIIDLSNSTSFGICMTIITLSITLTLIRISLLKRNLTLENKNSKKNQ